MRLCWRLREKVEMAQAGPDFYRDSTGQHRWRVVARNNADVLGDSGEGYHNELDAAKGLLALVESVDVQALRAQIAQQEGKTDDNS